ncbi:enoyl-CoA hydratase/isomerase family protein [Mucilaginibacter segetis]|uniref:Enoyl-CoA hydratase/isomerase family protein n=1 Tax=Mucilaginibacter segetis TaxID=2793071 RepID=A0A934UNT3_9SPHI|nr:enoyl-CoA hydratase-related protein [Mucilaginibacter segetis]MBK0380226.1 enoyl-CoA hydratase/isomerase family protein [Mucilaginibacter segetis]
MAFQNLLIKQSGTIQYIIINRENKLNALNNITIEELHNAIKHAFNDDSVGGVIITGAGQKAFVAGADIAEFEGKDIDEGREIARKGHKLVFDFIANGNKPVIAAINGYALGGGLELAMACHLRIAADNAKMGLPEVTLGLIPGYGGTQRLTQLAGRGKALELIMTADIITAQQALEFGLVNHVVESDKLLESTEELMQKILTRAPLALASVIRAVNSVGKHGFETEIDEFSRCFGTDDFKEGVTAFLQKRKPDFKGK